MHANHNAAPLNRGCHHGEAGTQAHPVGHVERHVLLRSGCVLYRPGYRRNAPARLAATNVDTAAKAADALKPLAGNFAYILFALGILGVGLIGVPVLRWRPPLMLFPKPWAGRKRLERKPRTALGFYGVIAVSVLSGLAIQYSPISPMKALFWSAVINGVVAVPLMVVIVILASKKSVMGDFTVSRPIVILGWIATAVMGAAALRMFIPF